MKYQSTIAVFILGAAAAVVLPKVIKLKNVRQGCVKVISKAIVLKDEAMTMVETAKETADDIVAEAKELNK